MNKYNTPIDTLEAMKNYMFGPPNKGDMSTLSDHALIDKIRHINDRFLQNDKYSISSQLLDNTGLDRLLPNNEIRRSRVVDYNSSNNTSSPENAVLAIIRNRSLKPLVVRDDLFTDLDKRSREQKRLVQIMKTKFVMGIPRNINLYDIVFTDLNKNEIQELIKIISTGWYTCETLKHLSAFSYTFQNMRGALCEIAFACGNLRNSQVEILLFSCINLLYNVLIHDHVEFINKTQRSLTALSTRASTDWFKPLITNARNLGLDKTPERVWKHFWALVINFYKVDFDSCLVGYTNRNDKQQMKKCARLCAYNIIRLCKDIVATDELLTYIVEHQNILSQSRMIITPIYHLDHTQNAGKRKNLPWFVHYNHLTDIQILQATKYIPIISRNHMYLLVVYYAEVADTSNPGLMNRLQMVSCIDSSDLVASSLRERRDDYEILKPLVVSWFHKIRPTFKEAKIITSRNVQISPTPQIYQFVQESTNSNIYTHMSLLLCTEYITDDILLLSAIKMIKDRITNPSLNPYPNPNSNFNLYLDPNLSANLQPNPIINSNINPININTTQPELNPLQGHPIYSFYFYCLLKMVTKSNRDICSSECR